MCLNNVRRFSSNQNFSLKSCKVNWPIVINCRSQFTSSNPVLISSRGANISSTEKRVLQWSYDTGKFSQRGTPLVNGKLKTLKWEENSAMRTPYDHSDRSLRLGGILQVIFDGGKWAKEEKHFHINVLELLGSKFTILTFTKYLSHFTIHIQVDNKVALAYLLEMGGTRSRQLLRISKSIWNYLLSHQITITAEYLPSRLNVRANWESSNAADSSDWKYHQKVYLKITKLLRTPTVDLFVSRLYY